MVARTGHVWHVGSERLNLIHVSIADASIVLVNSKLTTFRPTSSQALSRCIIDLFHNLPSQSCDWCKTLSQSLG